MEIWRKEEGSFCSWEVRKSGAFQVRAASKKGRYFCSTHLSASLSKKEAADSLNTKNLRGDLICSKVSVNKLRCESSYRKSLSLGC